MLPRDMHSTAWILFGGTLSSVLYGLVRLTNYDRAMAFGSGIGKTIFGLDPSGKGLAQMICAPAVIFALGSIASFQTLPSSAG